MRRVYLPAALINGRRKPVGNPSLLFRLKRIRDDASESRFCFYFHADRHFDVGRGRPYGIQCDHKARIGWLWCQPRRWLIDYSANLFSKWIIWVV